jgi:probable HAF family extracellular repeat protein
VEWSGGGVIYLGSTGTALSINNVGQVVGIGPFGATEWSGGQVITLGGLAGSYVQGSVAYSINDSGQAVGYNVFKHEGIDHASAVEWSGGEVVDLGSLHGTPDSGAYAINDAGQVVGVSSGEAVEWSSGQIIDLGPGVAYAINDAGQMVGARWTLGESEAVEWSGGQVIDLQEPPGTLDTIATGINNAGQVVGVSSSNAPEPSTWAMLLLGFTGLGFAGYRRVKVGATVGGDRGLMRRSGSTRSTNTRLPVVRIA